MRLSQATKDAIGTGLRVGFLAVAVLATFVAVIGLLYLVICELFGAACLA